MFSFLFPDTTHDFHNVCVSVGTPTGFLKRINLPFRGRETPPILFMSLDNKPLVPDFSPPTLVSFPSVGTRLRHTGPVFEGGGGRVPRPGTFGLVRNTLNSPLPRRCIGSLIRGFGGRHRV